MQNLQTLSMAVMVMGGRMQGGWGVTSCRLVTVITLLAILELHNMVGVAGTQMPQGRLLQNCFKVWIVGIFFCWHRLLGDDKLACVFSLCHVSLSS